MVVVIAGSRKYPHPEKVRAYVDSLPEGTLVITGGAGGVDTWAHRRAYKRGLPTEVLEADWALHGRRAGYVRNQAMVARADRVVCFWDGTSAGTRHTIQLTRSAGKPLEVIGVES